MPCWGDEGPSGHAESETERLRRQLNATTRAACELAHAIWGHDELVGLLSVQTKAWVTYHFELDEVRKNVVIWDPESRTHKPLEDIHK